MIIVTAARARKILRHRPVFLGAFAKLRKATITFVVSVLLSEWNNTAPIGRIFMKVDAEHSSKNLSPEFKFH